MAIDVVARAMAAQAQERADTAYVAGGSLAFENLPAPSAERLGYVYNITNAFVTTQQFVEGAGHTYIAGTNVGIIKQDDNYYYDVFGAMVNTSTFISTTDTVIVNGGSALA